MAAYILKMSDAETIKFLECYQNEPLLWDPTREDYKKRECRAAAARRIAAAMDIEGFTEIHVIMKFKNLRSSYTQELKKIGNSKKSGCSSADVYIPKVTWFKVMDSFLKPHVNPRRTQSNLEDPDTNNDISVKDITVPESGAVALHQFNQDQPSTSKEVEIQKLPTGKRQLLPDTPTTSRTKNKQRKPVDTGSGNVITSAMTKLDDIFKRAANIMKEDTFDHFGKYIASLLRSAPQDRSSQLQSEIVAMILRPPVPTDSRPSTSYTQYSGFTVHPEIIKSEPSSVETIHNASQDSLFSAEDTQDQ